MSGWWIAFIVISSITFIFTTCTCYCGCKRRGNGCFYFGKFGKWLKKKVKKNNKNNSSNINNSQITQTLIQSNLVSSMNG